MRKIILLSGLLASLAAFGAASGARADASAFSQQPQTRTGCIKPEIWTILERLKDKVGELELTAGCNGKHARHSFHYRGMAMDFRAVNASQSKVMALLKADPDVGGVIAEGHGLVHVDVGHRTETKLVMWRTGGHHRHQNYRHYAMR